MDTGAIVRTELFNTERGEAFPSLLVQNLERFTRQHYLIQDTAAFNNTLLGANKPGDLAVFMGIISASLGLCAFTGRFFTWAPKNTLFFGRHLS